MAFNHGYSTFRTYHTLPHQGMYNNTGRGAADHGLGVPSMDRDLQLDLANLDHISLDLGPPIINAYHSADAETTLSPPSYSVYASDLLTYGWSTDFALMIGENSRRDLFNESSLIVSASTTPNDIPSWHIEHPGAGDVANWKSPRIGTVRSKCELSKVVLWLTTI